MVSEEVSARLLKKNEPHESGETLVCRSWFKVKKQVFNVNYEHIFTAVEGDDSAEQRHDAKNFVHNYCRTCHSFQGSFIEDAITIFDHKFAYATRKWLYTAVTRATDLRKVLFYGYAESKEKEAEMVQYFHRI